MHGLKHFLIGAIGLCALTAFANESFADEVDDDLQVIALVGPGGKGSRAARVARDRLVAQGTGVLPRLLNAMDTDNIVAANWLRTVYEEIVGRELKKPKPKLPLATMCDYVRNPKRQGRVRRMLLNFVDARIPNFRRELIPMLLDDPEFRSDAVAMVLQSGDAAKQAGKADKAREFYLKAFRNARDSRQITTAAGRLKAVGTDVSIVEHMGFVVDWYLLGPFDAPKTTGFDLMFPPEKKVDLQGTYAGKDGRTIRWKRFSTTDRFGQSNLIQAIAPVKEAVGYAYAELKSSEDRSVRLRCGADDNCSVWLNGKKIFSRLQWLNGTRLDRFSAPAELRKGTNRLLVKICQGPQHKNPAVPNNWSLQLRFCDELGTGVPLTSLLPPLRKIMLL